MSNTPKTDKLFFPFGRDHTAAAEPSLLVCMTQFEILERENAALREQLKDCSAVVDRQQEQLDRNAAPSDTRNYYADGYEAGYQAGMAEKKPWVSLTGTEINHIFAKNVGYQERMMKDVENLLKEKNGG
ncbi:MAG: hypothetical protein EBU33_04025 [Sphingobacteriia bacterium]|nr:hypothetical protein [Sphingobacteriia bacterium]